MDQPSYSQYEQQYEQQHHHSQRIPPAYSQADELHLSQSLQQHQTPNRFDGTHQRHDSHPASTAVAPTQQQQSSPSRRHPPSPSRYPSSPSVPNVLQPAGGLAPHTAPGISTSIQTSTQSTLPTQTSTLPPKTSTLPSSTLPTLTTTLPALKMQMSPQQNDYRQPPSAGSYSRGSPAVSGGGGASGGTGGGYESGYHAYTPVTPSGPGQGFMSPGGTQRMPNAPLGLADIRPRADSGISDGGPGTLAYELAHPQPGTSNYLAPWTAYAFDWCKWTPGGNGAGKLALASYLEDGHNFIHIVDSQVVPTPQEAYVHGTPKWSLDFTKVAEATHSYPVTRLLWEPQSSQKQGTDLLATSGDHLRLWSLPSDATAKAPSPQTNSITSRDRSRPVTKLTPLALLSNSKTQDHTAPLTSLDWNAVSPSLIITSSIDTTCTIWDIPSLTAKTQLIAHDKEVYDVRFCANSMDVFVSCGQDGSVRMFDLRSLEHSTIIYEPNHKDERARMSPTLAQQTMSTPQPLLRLATSPHDPSLLATFAMDSNVVRLLDVRQPGQALFELRGHGGAINCIEWSPSRRGLLASGGDDCQVLIWDLLNQNTQTANGSGQIEPHRSPVASWQCDYEVNNVAWVPRLTNAPGDYGDWLGVGAGRGIWGVRLG